MQRLTDESTMPYGKFKGRPMEKVPAWYLHWLWVNGKRGTENDDPVADYICRNKLALMKEHPDGVWN